MSGASAPEDLNDNDQNAKLNEIILANKISINAAQEDAAKQGSNVFFDAWVMICAFFLMGIAAIYCKFVSDEA